MHDIISTFSQTGTLHHAYCILGRNEEVLPQLYSFFNSTFEFPTHANPDMWQKEGDVFTIDDSRELKLFHMYKSFHQSGRKVFVVCVNSITREAQNALLKILEDPGAGNHFFFILPSLENVLPTLRSRLSVIHHENASQGTVDGEKFLKMTKAARLAFVKELAEEVADGESTKTGVISFLDQVEGALRKTRNPLTKSDIWVFEEITKCRDYLRDRAPSTKQLLEHVSLII